MREYNTLQTVLRIAEKEGGVYEHRQEYFTDIQQSDQFQL